MKTLQRIKNIIRSRNSSTDLPRVGGDLLSELQKHLGTLDNRLDKTREARICARIDLQRWSALAKEVKQKKKENSANESKLLSLERLEAIANSNRDQSKTTLDSFEGKIEELHEIRARVVQAIALIEVENNVRSITVLSTNKADLEHHTALLEIETREIRRLLHTTDGLLEIMQ